VNGTGRRETETPCREVVADGVNGRQGKDWSTPFCLVSSGDLDVVIPVFVEERGNGL